jgi:hypothetical protein
MRQSASPGDSGEVDTARGTGGSVVSTAQIARERRGGDSGRPALTRHVRPAC